MRMTLPPITASETSEFVARAQALLGPRGFTQDDDAMSPWLTDWRGRYTGRALALASPASTQEVAALVSLCARYRIPLVPQGGNSGMSGGATPDPSGTAIVLSLRRLDAIRSLHPEDGQMVCGAGVILQTAQEAAAEQGLRFPLTLGGKGSATIGGLVATNAGGTQVLRHGTMRDQVLGIEAVLADGTVLDLLTPLKKDNRGFDLKQLLIGSEGTLGIVTAASLRLIPAICGRVVAWVTLSSIEDARRLLVRCEASLADTLEGFEIMPQTCLDAVLAYVPAARAPLGPAPWHALLEFAATRETEDALRERVEALLGEAMVSGAIANAAIAASEGQAEAFWQLRDSISAAERARGPALQHDISVPTASMDGFIREAITAVESRFAGTQALAFGHLGDGNVHFHVRAPEGSGQKWTEEEGGTISRFVHDLVTAWAGSISAEHGIGQMKRDELQRLGDPARLAVMRRVKDALDPLGILNPGKLLPLAQTGATA